MSEFEVNRRTLLRAFPAATAMILSEAGIAAQSADHPPQHVTREILDHALSAAGLEFSEDHRKMMLATVNRAFRSYEALRKVDVPLDTEPAFRFSPVLPGREIPSGASRFVPSKAKTVRRPASVDELAFAPVTELSALVRSRQVTSTELTKMYLQRLKRFSPKLNCTVTLTEELALKQAGRADQEIRRGNYRGPLHGIPYGAKDLFATKGIPTTWGAGPFDKQVFDYDATVIAKLEDAGAVLLGKLSMGALAMGGLWYGGMTKNPWNPERSSSGSSAGSASATSAGLVGFSIGTETLGSIITPSRICGVTGLRPTFGRVSRFGAMALSWTMDKVGPICRTVEDCALVFNSLIGPDGKDLTVVRAPFHWNVSRSLAAMRIAYVKSEFEKLEGEQKKLNDDALEALRKGGAKLEPVTLPQLEAGPLLILLNAEAAAAFDDLTRSGGVEKLPGQAPSDWPNSFRSARLIPAVEYIRAQRIRTLLMREMDALMSQWDVIVSPSRSASLSITNLTGHPQVVVPCGFIKNEPQAILFTGRLFQEGSPLRLAMAYQQSTPWQAMHPNLIA
jgi:Asp-tRNA(Asn)/Glu-tRNA(Gln) amidotransferase A subunit family amidase